MDAPYPKGMIECWQEFLSKDRTLDDLFTSPLCFPLQRRREMEKMHEVANRIKPTTIMEIGADKGGSVWAWCKCIPTLKRMIACEIRGTPYSQMMMKAFPKIEFQWIEFSSYDSAAARYISNYLETKTIDILFIDGDKTSFMKDFKAYRHLMSSPGIVFMHDIQDGEPRRAFTEVVNNGYHRHSTIVDISEYQDVLKKPLPHTVHDTWLMYWKGRSAGVGVIYI
jgi:predicted O-methyltransferase YrrM